MTNSTINYFDKLSLEWNDLYQNIHFRRRLAIVTSLMSDAKSEESQALDFGCGSGIFLREILRRGYKATGVDVSQGMLEVARESLKGFPGLTLNIIEDVDMVKGAFMDKNYYVVLCIAVLEYLNEPALLLERLASVVKPKGCLIVTVPNHNSILRRLERLVFQHPEIFRHFGFLEKLTRDDYYLNFVKNRFEVRDADRVTKSFGFSRQSTIFHVAPRFLEFIEGKSCLGMNVIIHYIRN